MLSDLLFRARALLRRREVDAELDEELHAHIDAQALKYERVGFSREEARRLANIEFGGLEQIRADCRDARGVTLVETVAHDLRYAWRVLRKDASFTVIAALTLALGIGASTTVFSVVNAILLKPLPYPDVDRVVFPWRVPPPSFNVGADEIPWGRVDFLAFAGETRAFESMGAFLGEAFNLTGAGEPARFDGARVSEGFFPSLGVAPQLGRMFRAEEDRPGHELEVILSDRLWRERFNADPTVVGRTVNLNGSPYTIVGVMPPGFAFPHSAGMPGSFTLPRQTLLWAPLALSRGGRVRGEPSELAVLGRLAPGFTAGWRAGRARSLRAPHGSRVPARKGLVQLARHTDDPSAGGGDPTPAAAPPWRRRRGAAHRLFERGEPAAHAIDRAHARVHGTSGPRRWTHPPDSSADNREPSARGRRRSWRPCSRLRRSRLRQSLRSVQRSAAGGSAHRPIGAAVRDGRVASDPASCSGSRRHGLPRAASSSRL